MNEKDINSQVETHWSAFYTETEHFERLQVAA
jgi:hypothetical protein